MLYVRNEEKVGEALTLLPKELDQAEESSVRWNNVPVDLPTSATYRIGEVHG